MVYDPICRKATACVQLIREKGYEFLNYVIKYVIKYVINYVYKSKIEKLPELILYTTLYSYRYALAVHIGHGKNYPIQP